MVTTSNFARPARLARAASIMALVLAGSAIASLGAAAPANAGLPEIRISERNRVPSCVTPERLMTFLRSRNHDLDGRWRDIAQHYRLHGNTWRVRWDYAFFQMLVETNFLTYRTPGGGMGDVHPRQNNFAGIGATGGVSGDSFPNPSIGVLAQIQHLVAYSGERLANPTAPRTRLKMDEILTKSKALGRPVTFQDLAGRWAVDAAYGRTIEGTAQSFRSGYCGGQGVISSDSKPLRQRMSANWPRPDRGPDRGSEKTVAAGREARGNEPATRSNLGRIARNKDEERESEPERRPAAKPKRPLERPIVTSSLRRSEQAEAPAASEKSAAQRVLPSAPPPVIKPKPAAEQQAQSTTALPPALPAKPLATEPAASVASAPQASAPATSNTAPMPSATSEKPATAAAQSPPSNSLPSVSSPASAASPPASRQAAAAPSTTGSAPARPAAACKIFRASYGGPKTVLIQAQKDGITNYTLLEVTTGREQDQTKAFMDAHARGGKVVGEYPAEAEALKKSFELCPGG